MATLNKQHTWVPYETTKDCSLGFCSIHCPQWCYVIFSPPPPFPSLEDDDAGATAFSPLVIAIIGILAAAFLLVSYYTIISKYCTRLDPLRRGGGGGGEGSAATADDHGVDSMRQEAAWNNFTPSDGIDEALISKIAVYRYRPDEGVVDGKDCSVCLGEFREDDSLRLLPKCSHAFHRQCIDTWLSSHSNCPLCRAGIVPAATPAAPPQLPPPPPPEPAATNNNHELSIVIEDVGGAIGEEESNSENGCDDASSKDPLEESCDIIEVVDDGGGDTSATARISIADVLRMSMEDEFLAAKDQGLLSGPGSSRRCGGEHSKGSGRSRGLHCVMSPVPMKRSLSGGRFCFNRQRRGRNAGVPI